MKLLTTIAAVLISISAYSQDLIEYNEGTFTQNGEELSMEQITVLTVLHKAGRGNFRRGNRFNRMYEDGDLRILNNGLNFLGGAATGLAGGYLGFWGGVGFSLYGDDFCSACWVVTATGAGLTAVSYKAFSRITFPKGCLRKRDKQFNKVADKINQAIAAGGPLVQSSNQ